MQHGESEAKLIPLNKLESREKKEMMVIQKQMTHQGKEVLKAIQPKVQERERVRSIERERGGFEIGD